MAPRCLVKICASLPLFITNPIWSSLSWNPVSAVEKPVNNSLSRGIDLNKIPIILFSDHMQLVRDMIGKWHQWYKYSRLNLKQICSGPFADIFFWRIGLHWEGTSPATSRWSLLCDTNLQLSFTFSNQIYTYHFHFLRLWTALLCIPWPYCYVSTNNLC
jgi:hypothetical protein